MKEVKKLSKLQKWYLKYTDKAAYWHYKTALRQYREDADFMRHSREMGTHFEPHLYKTLTAFKHSGNCGDIIYSLPAVFELAKAGTATFAIELNRKLKDVVGFHPLGNVMMNKKVTQMLTPLLLHQPRIEAVSVYHNETVDYNLDLFRDFSFPLDRGSIVRWYFYVYGITADTSKPWLEAPKDDDYRNAIVIARSHRYRSPVVDYSFLKMYANLLFVGVPEEYESMKQMLPGIVYKPVSDFLEMATIINSCRLFIGNQSFPFSLAEGLKVKRLLEVYYKAPNVIVEGEGANDFMYQPQFEYAVRRLLAE